MSFTQWQSWQMLNSLYQTVQEILSEASSYEQASTIWVGSSGSTWIADITIHETETDVTLRVQMPETLVDLKVKVSPETAVIQGKPIACDVEGYFSASSIQNLIPLPIAVHPESVQVKLQDNVLMLVLPKSGRIQRQTIAVQVTSDDRCLEQSNVLNAECC
ncbi:Hsp20/alpha crystallin family protein [Egbenema bharatensis]|uniref:Hsp20/alpha crystallin family protein n=1 Tax=Egbenema bharatensis TaxID=3463334 RepID=UPI003A872498